MKEDLNLNKKMGALVYDAAIDRMDIRSGLNRFHGGLHWSMAGGSLPESRKAKTGIW